ncbi:MAG: hypothetical protein E6124_04315 [Blautia producta]|uniref:hypothetical protein n=1 Tax=Blautia producta TaxID=33035 RepID=UPI00290E0DF2|nr:hypothetical protein [Blautia producta]MDU5381404.1 hypothetical protein [Blautia producta]MDU6882477.1 hypothetical protein [Blautia producta]
MEKMNLPLSKFLTLVGPAQIIEVVEEDETEPVFRDKAAKIRDYEDLLPREVKHIEPKKNKENVMKLIFKIWIY